MSQQNLPHDIPSFRTPDPRRKTPLIAALLSFMPGIGHVYLGYTQRAFFNFLIFGLAIALVAAEELNAIEGVTVTFLIFFWLYCVIDSYRLASLYNLTLEGFENIAMPEDTSLSAFSGSYAGGVLLTIVGVVALSYTVFGFSLDWLEMWWPIAPTLGGIYLIYSAYINDQKSKQ